MIMSKWTDYLYKNINSKDKNSYMLYPKDNVNHEQHLYYCDNHNNKGNKTWSQYRYIT